MTLDNGYASRSQVRKIFEPVDPTGDPEGLVTRFVAYELSRLIRSRTEFNLKGALSDRLKALMWYLNSYAYHRRGAERIPLSGAQINFLNAPAPIAGYDPSVTVAFHNFAIVDLPNEINLGERSTLQHYLYWWCVEKLPPLNLEDRLVTKHQLDILSADTAFDGQKYPLSVFMARYAKENSSLDWLDVSNPRDRVALYYYIVLQSFSEPHLARFVPREIWRQATASPFKGGSQTFLELLLAKHAGGSTASIEPLELLRQGERILNAYGFSTTSGWSPNRNPLGDTGTCFDQRWTLGGDVLDGVNVIGPLRSTSGLGQATRLSLEVLKEVEQSPPSSTLFGLDNPAPVGFASKVETEWPNAKRSINLIHLNAESAPLAMAYLPHELYERSYNIGYFFWELDKLPACHYLALETLDEIWVSSEYNREIYATSATIPVINVGMAVEAVPDAKPLDRSTLHVEQSTYVFLMVFDSFSFVERKNPLAVIDAFALAFPCGDEDVCLIIKTQNRTKVRDPYQMRVWDAIDRAMMIDTRIVLIDETYKYTDLLGLKLASDCYVSLHRSEGWGFGMIEAMQLGRAVICTAYSGNMEFCNDDTAFLVNYELTAPLEEEYIFVPRGSRWADPDLPSAAERMREVFKQPDLGKAKGEAAKEFIQQNFSSAAIGNRYAARLSEIRTILIEAKSNRVP